MEDFLNSIDAFKDWLSKENKPISDIALSLLDRAQRIDKDINALRNVDKDKVLEKAKEIDAKKGKGKLWGLPIALKDNICRKGELTTCSSHILDGFRPPYNATVVEKLKSESALILGSTNMDEFAFGSSCETSYYGPTKNPLDKERIPGGSSGGSAASVAAGEVVASLGSDTGGSIRQPASMCGVVGMKPTYGRVSRYGLIAFASSLDQIGPFTRNVTDCARVLEVISGYDEKDSTSVNIEVPSYEKSLTGDVKGLRVGIPKEYFQTGIDKGVEARVKEAIDAMKKLGAKVIDISLPHTKYAVSCYYIIGPAEASSNLARYEGVHYGYRSSNAKDLIDMYIHSRNEGFGAEAKRRILLGTYALSSGYYEAYYLKALRVRTKMVDDFNKAFSKCDVLLTPTAPTTAFKIGERMEDPLAMYLSDVFTIPANLAGIPAISIPCGSGENNMPVGLQFMAKPFGEELVLNAAYAFEQNKS